MQEITLNSGNGVQRDADGRIVSRLDLPSGTHEFPDGHSVDEFESFSEVLALDWPPQATLSLSKQSVTADGQDSVTVTLKMVAETAREWGTATLTIAGDSYQVDVSDGSHSETVTTTTTDSTIPVQVEHPDHAGDSATIEVVQS